MKKKLRILFNTWAGAMFQKGGGEVQMLQTQAALEKLGHEVLYFDQWSPQRDVDLVHQFSTEQGVEHVVRKYRELGIPVAVSTILWTPPPRDHYQFHRIREILDRASVLFPNSELEAETLSEYFVIPRQKFVKTRNSIGERYFTRGTPDAFRKKHGIEGDFVLSVANIDTRKNTELLVQACQQLGVPLVTVGHVKDAPYYDRFKAIYPGYRHLGPIEDEEMLKSAYTACSLFALPSLCETPGIAALEAASQGARITITEVGPTREYFGQYATYVDPSSVGSIRNGIAEGLKKAVEPDFARTVVAEYRWSKTAEEILTGYAACLSAN